MGLAYHRSELEVAMDRTHPSHIEPPIDGSHGTILDIGCGMGQTLIGANLAPSVAAYGIDRNEQAILAGRDLVSANIKLSVGSGERLEFPDNFFDLVICRVAIPYMRVGVVSSEMFRVLKPGGSVWLVLHPAEFIQRRAWVSFRQKRFKDVLYCGYILLNGCLLNLTGTQISFGNRTETFQSQSGIRRVLQKRGFDHISITRVPHFTAQAQKPMAV